MLISKKAILKWHGFTKDYYVNKGYTFTKIGEEFEVDIKDLQKGSSALIIYKCDYCGEEYNRSYKEYNISHSEEYGDACRKCQGKKNKRILIDKYGGVGLQVEKFKEKAMQTNEERYGCKVPFQNKEVYAKLRKTQEENYGGIGMASEITRSKIESTNLRKRGVKNPSQDESIKKKKKETCLIHYGVDHHFKVKEIVEQANIKARKTMVNNNTLPTSKPEKEICKMLEELYGGNNCFPSYQEGSLVFDCLLVIEGQKIDVEYDGWYWHKDRVTEDRRRNYKVISLGYKVLRIISKKELPSKKQIQEAINFLIVGKHHFAKIELDIE